MTDYYGLLGVPRNATQKEIKRAYQRLASKHHPDKNENVDPGVMAAINRAYDVLGNEDKRKLYDLGGEEAVKQGTDLDALAMHRLKVTLHQLIHASITMENPFGYDLIRDLRQGVKESTRQSDAALKMNESMLRKLEKLQKKRKSKTTGENNFYEQCIQEQITGVQHTIETIKREIEVANRALELIDDLEEDGSEKKSKKHEFLIQWGQGQFR